MITLERKIYPVGQGLFCSEILKEDKEVVHAVVYDCGSENRAKLHSNIEELKDELGGSPIDAVFISHFHRDHINGLEELMDIIAVKRVFLPQLDPYQFVRGGCVNSGHLDEVSFLSLAKKVIYSEENNSNNEEQTQYIEVPPFINASNSFLSFFLDFLGENMDDNGIAQQLHYIKNNLIDYKMQVEADCSLQLLRHEHSAKSRINYIPFNIVDNNCLLFNYLFIKKFKEFSMNHRESLFYLLRDNQKRQEIIELYKVFFKNINESSMPVLSYMTSNDSNDASCLYTGDYSHNTDKDCLLLKLFYCEEWPSISIIQVPHHGSRLDNPTNLYQSVSRNECVVSYGSQNKYGHPHIETIENIKHTGRNILYEITEKTDAYESLVKIY